MVLLLQSAVWIGLKLTVAGLQTEDFPPEVEGNIGLISRGPEGGSCAFATKSANAGTAGAVALIVFDYVPGAGPINGVLSIEDPPQGPTIPTSSISNELGLDLSARIQAGEEIIVDSFYTATYGDIVYRLALLRP